METGPIVDSIVTIIEYGLLAFAAWHVGRWKLRENKAKRSGNGKNRRVTDGNPGNTQTVFDKINYDCTRHERTLEKLVKELNELTVRVAVIEEKIKED